MLRSLRPALAILSVFITGHALGQTNSVLLKGPTGSLISQHRSITAAYAAIPATLTQAYTIELAPAYTGANELYPIIFVNKPGASSTNTITLTITDPANTNLITADPSSYIFLFDNASYVHIDGKRNKDFDGLRYRHRSEFPSIELGNGASENIISSVCFENTAINKNSIAISFIGTGIAKGNTNNIVENCFFDTYYTAVRSEGSGAYPNKHLSVRNNFMSDILNHAVKLGYGAGPALIEGNEITNRADSNYAAFIMAENFSDTAIITSNKISIYGASNVRKTAPFRGMYLEGSALGAYFFVANNFVSNPPYQYAQGDSTTFNKEDMTDLAMIEFGGTNKIHADVYFNTLVADNELSTNLAPPAGISSVSFLRSESHPNSVYTIKNNLFVNKRHGGTTGTIHAAIRLSNTNNVDIDYNTYEVDTNSMLARIGSNSYATFSDYLAALGSSNEAHGDSMHVPFMSDVDIRLGSLAYQDTRLYGTPVATVFHDAEQDLRANNYRGADEYVIKCGTRTPVGPISAYPGTGCPMDMTRIQLHGEPAVNGIDYQWQYRPIGTPTFIDIPGAKTNYVFVRFTDSVEYRLKDSCLSGSAPLYSNTIVISGTIPGADSIVAIKKINAYTFYLAGAKNADDIKWYIGGVHQVTNDTFDYALLTPGRYTITAVLVGGNCTDTLTREFELTLSVDDIAKGRQLAIYPNPSQDHVHVNINAPALYTITDLSGRQIQAGETQTGRLSIEALTPGNYILTLTDNKGPKQYGRFVKQ